MNITLWLAISDYPRAPLSLRHLEGAVVRNHSYAEVQSKASLGSTVRQCRKHESIELMHIAESLIPR